MNANANETRDEYVERFRVLTREGLDGLFVPGRPPGLAGGRLERFAIVDEEASVHAETRFSFRGRRFRYERQIWPPDFPLEIKTALYVEHLRERVLTGRYDAGGEDPEAVVDL